MLTTSEIKQFIDEDIASEKKRRAAEGQRYYEAEHDILNTRLFYWNDDGNLVEDKTRANIKISHPFYTELCDQVSSYMLSFKDKPIKAKENVTGLQDRLDMYFNSKFWAECGELLTGAYSKGFDYIYGFKNANNRLSFSYADSMGVVEVESKYASDKQNHILYHYIDRIDKDKKEIIKIQDWTDKDITFYVQETKSGKIELDKSIDINPQPHVLYKDEKTGKDMGFSLGYIPFWRLDNNRKQFSGLKAIKGLIDDYDLHACSLSNNLKDFDTPLYVVSGYQGDDLSVLQQNLKTKKIVGVDEEGGINVQTVDIPYQARKEKLDIDERNIYRFGMGFNSSQVGDGNITNIVIQSRYTLLNLKADKLQIRFNSLLEDIIKIVLDEINEEFKTDYQFSDVVIKFERDTATNETENIANAKIKAETKQIEINTILNVAVNIGDEKAAQLICEQLDIDYNEIKDELEKMKQENNIAGAKATLESVVTSE